MTIKVRAFFVRQKVSLANMLRGLLGEFGVVGAQGDAGLGTLINLIRDETDDRLIASARAGLRLIADQYEDTLAKITDLDKKLIAQVRADKALRDLITIPGVGPITASAIAAQVPKDTAIKTGRHFATAWLGLAPKANSSGGKERLGRISKMDMLAYAHFWCWAPPVSSSM